MNSEIIGCPTDVPWAFIFERVDMQPRHPGQLYEAICYFFFFFIGWAIYRKSLKQSASDYAGKKPLFDIRVGSGFYFGLAIFLIFLSRILIEFTKENQVEFESSMVLNMGQLLSIPFVLLGIYCMLGGKYSKKISEFK
jgi:prolipoprotein diacylglyceryltransferase